MKSRPMFPIPLRHILGCDRVVSRAKAEAVVAPPTAALDLDIESELKVEPSEVPPSPDYVPSSPIHLPASPDNHPGSNTESEPFEDESEPIEDAPKADSTSLSVSSSATPSVPRSGPSRRRSRHASSSGTSHSPPGPLSHRRNLVSSYSTPPSLVGSSRKRCMSPTTSPPAAASVLTILSSVPADCLPPSEPAISPVHHGLAVEERLDEKSEVIGEMYEHLLEIPLLRIEGIEEELQTLRARVVSLERENTYLRARVRAAEMSKDST
ncbi:hypothetical protein Tco_0105470 [Tanacetum coccineum]